MSDDNESDYNQSDDYEEWYTSPITTYDLQKDRTEPFYKTGHYVCSRCGKEIRDDSYDLSAKKYSMSKNFSSAVTEHAKIHYEESALEFIKTHQPVGGKVVLARFKRISLRELETQGKIKFSDKHMAWVLQSYDLSSVSKETLGELKFDTLQGAPCINCKLVESCHEEGEISPRTCQWIKDWVDPEVIEKKILNDQNDDTYTIKVAKFFLHYATFFNIKGKIIENGILEDENGDVIMLILNADDKHLISIGDEVKLSNVCLKKSTIHVSLNCMHCKIQKLNSKL